MDLDRRLTLLSDAARFDAPCIGRAPARAGGRTRAALPTLQPAAVPPTLIQESVAGDGRTVRLLRLLLSSHCIHDCAYCPLRRSADPERARLSARDVVRVVMDHHRRGLIDGLFLSSAVDRDADHTMGELVAVARACACEQHYLGYVHLKVVPRGRPGAHRRGGALGRPGERERGAPLAAAPRRAAPGRRLVTMTRAMDRLRDGIADAHEGWRWRQRTAAWPLRGFANGRLPRYAPAGQVTQLVVGVDDTSDAELLRTASALYGRERLRRVYYGGFVPTAGQPAGLPDVASPHVREVRLYQADWLIRNYGFAVDELAPADAPDLAPDVDPKFAWALRHPEWFPVDIQRAPREALLRVPGFGRARWTGCSPCAPGTACASRTSRGCACR
jgi:predicted DNA-binding helix-hairpin-helix protein